ncbi:hypothetical protein BT96DRAFT_838015, partial [Gymnopus androsaceus JB14]
HEVYEGKYVGLILALHLACQWLTLEKLSIWIDNTAAITATDSDSSRPSHYLLNFFHSLLIQLQTIHPNAKVLISWVPGHANIEGNKRADEEAKKTAVG